MLGWKFSQPQGPPVLPLLALGAVVTAVTFSAMGYDAEPKEVLPTDLGAMGGTSFLLIGHGYCRTADNGDLDHIAQCGLPFDDCKLDCANKPDCKGIAYSSIDKMGHCNEGGEVLGQQSNVSRCVTYTGSRSIKKAALFDAVGGNDDYTCLATAPVQRFTGVYDPYTIKYMTPYGEALPRLPALVLKFDTGASGVDLLPAADVLQKSHFLNYAPVLEWHHIPKTVNTYGYNGNILSIFFVDFGPSKNPGSFWPLVHSLWTGCTSGTSTTCTAVQPWRQPGNTEVKPNRYTFLLVSTPVPLKIHGEDAVSLGEAGTNALFNFDFERLLGDNPGLTPIGYTYMSVHGSRVEKP